jgi:hypothetical protein
MVIEYNTLEERKLFLEAEIELDLAIGGICSDIYFQYSSNSHFGLAYPFDECRDWLKDRVKKESSSDRMYEDFVEFYNETILSFQKKCADRSKENAIIEARERIRFNEKQERNRKIFEDRAKENLKQSTCQDSPYQTQKERHEEQRGFDNDAYCNDDEPKKFSLSDYDEY